MPRADTLRLSTPPSGAVVSWFSWEFSKTLDEAFYTLKRSGRGDCMAPQRLADIAKLALYFVFEGQWWVDLLVMLRHDENLALRFLQNPVGAFHLYDFVRCAGSNCH